MTDLFRFMVLRAPEQVDPSQTILIGGSSTLTTGLKEAAKSVSPQAAMGKIAQTFIAQNKEFVQTAKSLIFGEQLAKIADELQNPVKLKSASNSLPDLAQHLFPNLAQIVTDKRFLDDKRRIHDSLVALQISPLAENPLAGSLVNLSRAVDVVERAAADSSLKEPGALADAATRIVVLPPDLFPVPSPLARQDPTKESTTETQIQSEQNDHVAALKAAILAINNMIAVNKVPSETNQAVSAKPAQFAQTGGLSENMASESVRRINSDASNVIFGVIYR